MNSEVENIINEAVRIMIEHTGDDKVIDHLIKKHDKKIHFVPKRYRVFGGILQSLNIQFGNFIEELMAVIVSKDPRYEIVNTFSGKKSNQFYISKENERRIDTYITSCQTESDFDLDTEFNNLMDMIVANKGDSFISFTHDIDLLFRDKMTGVYYYLEIKYNDDHDTGKFVDINRKLLKTSAYLIRELNITDMTQFKPILFFFNNKKMKGNIYIPEQTNIYRGERFFNEFLKIGYSEVEQYMANLSESDTTVNAFNQLYNKVMEYGKSEE